MSDVYHNKYPMPSPRPILDLPKSRLDKVLELFAFMALCLLIGVVAGHYYYLDEEIPVDFDINGVAVQYGSRATVWTLPIIGIVMYIFLTLISRVPHLFKYPFEITYENAERVYRAGRAFITFTKGWVTLVLAGIAYHMVDHAANGKSKLDNYSFVGLLIMFLIAPAIAFIWIFYQRRKLSSKV
jgi:uncharacterized membrane protein